MDCKQFAKNHDVIGYGRENRFSYISQFFSEFIQYIASNIFNINVLFICARIWSSKPYRWHTLTYSHTCRQHSKCVNKFCVIWAFLRETCKSIARFAFRIVKKKKKNEKKRHWIYKITILTESHYSNSNQHLDVVIILYYPVPGDLHLYDVLYYDVRKSFCCEFAV